MARRHGQFVYGDTERAFTERRKSHLANVQNPRKWWTTVKAALFGASSSLSTLVARRGKLVWSANENVSLFWVHFDAKQCSDCFQQPHSCDPSPVLCSVAFQSSFVGSLLDLDIYGGNDLDVMFLNLFTSRSLGSWHSSLL